MHSGIQHSRQLQQVATPRKRFRWSKDELVTDMRMNNRSRARGKVELTVLYLCYNNIIHNAMCGSCTDHMTLTTHLHLWDLA